MLVPPILLLTFIILAMVLLHVMMCIDNKHIDNDNNGISYDKYCYNIAL